MTAFGLFLVIAMICVGGLAIDVANAVMVRTHLQVAADSAAHAALMSRGRYNEAQSKTIAIGVAQASLPVSKFGDTIRSQDIAFGTWDNATKLFTASAGADSAVLVSTQRLSSRGNPMATYFLKFVGLWSMDVVSDSIFETYYPTCFREGFVANGRIDVQSNNRYRAGFCIHSNSHVEVNQNNLFENGVIVSMPDKANIVLPASGWTGNPGLQQALRSGSYRVRILQRVQNIINGFDDPNTPYFRHDYLTLPAQTNVLSPGTRLDSSVWRAGEIHEFTCASGGSSNVTIPANTTLQNGVIKTNCTLKIGSGVTLRDVLIISESAATRAIDGAAGVTLGLDDNCASGGGTQIVTKGGVRFPANLSLYGSQIIAMGNIDFAANANGVEGASMVAGGEIDSTSNMDMGVCNGSGLENRFVAEYFRMAN